MIRANHEWQNATYHHVFAFVGITTPHGESRLVSTVLVSLIERHSEALPAAAGEPRPRVLAPESFTSRPNILLPSTVSVQPSAKKQIQVTLFGIQYPA